MEEDWWAVILKKQLLELRKLDACEVKEKIHEYNDHIRHKKQKVFSYGETPFSWVHCPVVGLWD